MMVGKKKRKKEAHRFSVNINFMQIIYWERKHTFTHVTIN